MDAWSHERCFSSGYGTCISTRRPASSTRISAASGPRSTGLSTRRCCIRSAMSATASMHLARMLKSTPVWLASAASLLAISSFLSAGAIAYTSMNRDLVDRLDRQITETFNALQGLYEKDDTADLIAAVERMAQATTEYDLVYG